MKMKDLNVILVIHDGYGHYVEDDDWCTWENFEVKKRFEEMELKKNGFIEFSNAISPAASTIMSIESILSGVYAAKAHKIHWREWPTSDKFHNLTLGDFLETKDYQVRGFSYLLNSENWMPAIKCYRPDLYKDFPSEKRDTHSQWAVISALKHYFENDYEPKRKQCLFVHSVHVYDFWKEMNDVFNSHGLTENNTVFVLTADHNFPEGYGRMLNYLQQLGYFPPHHTDLSEHNTRVPFYIRYPFAKNREIPDLVSGYDVTPTILGVLGLYQGWPGAFDGENLYPLCEGNSEKESDRCVRSDNLYPFQVGGNQGRIIAVRNQKFKLVIKLDEPRSYINYRLNMGWNVAVEKNEFYDLINDPKETKNLIKSQLNQDQKINLSKLLDFYESSSREIYNQHKILIRDEFQKLNHKRFNGKTVLLIQSTNKEVFNILCDQFLDGDFEGMILDICVRPDYENITFSNIRKRYYLSNEGGLEFNSLLDIIGHDSLMRYDFVIFCSYSQGDWFGEFYDGTAYEAPSINIADKLLTINSNCEICSLGLDSKILPFKDFNKKTFRQSITRYKKLNHKNIQLIKKIIINMYGVKRNSHILKFVDKLINKTQGN